MNAALAMCAFIATQTTESYVPQYQDFCERNPAQCQQDDKLKKRFDLNKTSFSQIYSINQSINKSVVPKTDMEVYGIEDYWNLPNGGAGDCDDYALLKQKVLEENGVAKNNLVLAIVKDENNQGHLVLILKTSIGDYVLDNKTDEIKLWRQTPYKFTLVQSYVNNKVWYGVEDCK